MGDDRFAGTPFPLQAPVREVCRRIAGFVLLRYGVLEVNFCARPLYAELLLLCESTVRALSGLNNKNTPENGGIFIGGRYRIRTYHLHNVNVAL